MPQLEHPCVTGLPIAVVGRPLQLSAGTCETLIEDLCSIAFCCPHLGYRITEIAVAVGLPEVVQYVKWMDEAAKGGRN